MVPKDDWNLDMCIQWLQDEVAWNKDNIEAVRSWLEDFELPGMHIEVRELKDKTPPIPVNDINKLQIALKQLQPPGKALNVSYTSPDGSLGPYADPLKRWAECVSRGEEEIKTVEEYNTMKHTCGKVMVLRYSDLLKSERNDKALKELRDDVLATELRLSQLRGEEKEIDAVAAGVLGDVEARVLPEHLAWPCFFVGKQAAGAQNAHVLLRRVRQPVESMEKDAIKYFETHKFRNSRKILWLGAAGIGKSSYTSVIAEQLVRNMSTKGNPSLVTFRIDTFLYHITCPHPGSIRVETVALRFIDDLIAISYGIVKRNGVLLMELMEKDTCPSAVCHMLSSSSVKDADEVFKEQMKSGNTLIYYISPYEMWEVRAAAKLLYHLHEGKQNSELLNGDQRDSKLTCDEFVERALKKYYEVGGLPRYLFQNSSIYVSRKHDIAATDFFAALQDSRPFWYTSSAQFIIAPINLSSTSWCSTVEGACIRFVYLSDICERQVVKRLSESNLNKCRVMRALFGDWLTEEVLLFASLQHHMVDTVISMFKAEWYKNPGSGRPLTSGCEMDDTFVTSMQPCIHMLNIGEPICTKPVIDLEEFTLYKCMPNVNMTVADCFVVDHVNRRLWLFYNSLSVASNHPFKISNLRKIEESMRIKENNYTAHLCYVRSSHRGGDVGLEFTKGGQTADLPADINAIYRFYVVRIHYEGIDRRVHLPNATNVKNSFDSEMKKDGSAVEDCFAFNNIMHV